MSRGRPYLWPRDTSQPASGKPGAVHGVQASRLHRRACAACSAYHPEPSLLGDMVLIESEDTGTADARKETEPLVTLESTQPLMFNNTSCSTLPLQGRA